MNTARYSESPLPIRPDPVEYVASRPARPGEELEVCVGDGLFLGEPDPSPSGDHILASRGDVLLLRGLTSGQRRQLNLPIGGSTTFVVVVSDSHFVLVGNRQEKITLADLRQGMRLSYQPTGPGMQLGQGVVAEILAAHPTHPVPSA